MKKVYVAVISTLFVGVSIPARASFGDGLVGGVVGGVVGSVITNEIYHSGSRHRSTRHTSHRRRHRSQAPIMTDELRIQKALSAMGFYNGAIDGKINSYESRNAIRQMNSTYGFGDTAYLSPQARDTLIYIGSLIEMDRYLNDQGESRRSRTRRTQAALKVLGFYHGTIDGSTGPMTRRAIADYRNSYGMAPGYRLDYESEYRLIDTARRANDRNINDSIESLKRSASAVNPSASPQPMAQPVVQAQQPMTQPVAQPMVQPVAQPVARPMPPQPVAQPVVQPAVQTVSQPLPSYPVAPASAGVRRSIPQTPPQPPVGEGGYPGASSGTTPPVQSATAVSPDVRESGKPAAVELVPPGNTTAKKNGTQTQ
jgi:peptidoglycan hydrolase-like protein with peptidoglycan-binding domain